MGRFNRPPCQRNRLFPKSAHLVLRVLGVLDSVTVYLEEFDARDEWILEIRIYQQSGKYVSPLMVQTLLSCILSSSRLHGFLYSVEITQECSSVGGGYMPQTKRLWDKRYVGEI